MNKLSQQALWERIKRFNFNDPDSHFPFSQKLAHEKNWSTAFAQAAIEEYRKFIFLCCVMPGGASPSALVDEVWHLHLTYTHNYWIEFCKNTLQQDVHHHPSKGGQAEKEKYLQWYQQTLQEYQVHFGQAPANIWPTGSNNSLSTLPGFYRAFFLQRLLFFTLPGILAYVTLMHIYKSKGPDFLVHFAVVTAMSLGALIVMLMHKKQQIADWIQQFLPLDADIFQRTRMLYGAHRAYQTALLQLCNDGLIEATEYSFRINNHFLAESNSKNPLTQHLLNYFVTGETFTYEQGFSVFNTHFKYHPVLEHLHTETAKKDWWPWLLPGVLFLLGLVRLLQGMMNNKPVGYLMATMLVLCFVVLALVYVLRGSLLCRKELRQWANENEDAGQPLLNEFAANGTTSLKGIAEFALLTTAFTAITPAQRKDHNSGSDGCSSGNSCSSAGDGGGCGGGGCGGCGGGD